MANPVLVELTRGERVESFHRGAFALLDASGGIIASMGDIDQPVFPRSAIKVLQALPLVESGAAEAVGFGNRELALACASHSGEPVHVEVAGAMLQKAGLTSDALACGTQWPLESRIARDLARSGGAPTQLHNNCSGKHAGMLAFARHIGVDIKGYENPDHPVQEAIRTALEEMTGEKLRQDVCGTDGCSVPTWAASLTGFARAFASMAGNNGLSETRREAFRRLMAACASEPHLVEGEGRFGTSIMRRFGSAAFVKGGAEGFYCAAFPEKGFGFALKIDDGARRGAEAAAAFTMAAILLGDVSRSGELYDRELKNWKGLKVGEINPSAELQACLENLISSARSA